MDLERDDDITRRDPAGDEPSPPRDPATPAADDFPTTELSAADPGATQDWPAPDAAEPGGPRLGDDDATREHGVLGDDEGSGEPAAFDDDATRERGALGDEGDAYDDAPVESAEPDPAGAARDPEAMRDWPAGDTRETRIVSAGERDRAPDPLPDADFPVVWRGYDAHAVDAYVAAAEAAIASFEERTLPTVAVQRALDRVGEQTASILREAEQAAEETARVSRAQADDRVQRAEREAVELREAAEKRVRDLDDDIERLWQERQRLIDATRDLSDQLRATAEAAEARFPPAAPAEPPLPPFDAADDGPDDGVPLGEHDVESGPDDAGDAPPPDDAPGPDRPA